MEDVEDHDAIAADLVDDHIRKLGQHPLPGARDASNSSEAREISKEPRSRTNASNDPFGCGLIAAADVVTDGLNLAAGLGGVAKPHARPNRLQSASISSSLAIAPWRTASCVRRTVSACSSVRRYAARLF